MPASVNFVRRKTNVANKPRTLFERLLKKRINYAARRTNDDDSRRKESISCTTNAKLFILKKSSQPR